VSEIVLTREEAARLAEGGYVLQDVSGRSWRLVHESYSRPFPKSIDRHVSLTAAEVDVIVRTAEGLVVGETTIRSEVAS
jgi:hypothetical protein